jgi:hypothetical protein
MKPFALLLGLVLVVTLAFCPTRMQAQGVVEYGVATSAVGTLGAKIGAAIGGVTKQVTPTLQQQIPNPNPSPQSHAAARKPVAGKVGAKKDAAAAPEKDEVSPAANGPSTVQFDSTPSGAEISVDNVVLGHTPATLTLAKGIHAVQLTHDGYTSWQKTLLVGEGEKLSFNPALKDQKTSTPLFTVQR